MVSPYLQVRNPPNQGKNSTNIDKMNQSVDPSASTTTNLFPTTTSRGADTSSGPGSANVYYLVVCFRHHTSTVRDHVPELIALVPGCLGYHITTGRMSGIPSFQDEKTISHCDAIGHSSR